MLTRALAFFIISVLNIAPLAAKENILAFSFGKGVLRLSAHELLIRPDAQTITIPADVAYRRAITYRAVPLIALIGDVTKYGFDTIEARAKDGFVSQIPAALVMQGASGGAVPWIAIEEAKTPWPNLPDKQASAGPFYLVWQNPERSNIGSEQWPYALTTLTGVEAPARRWQQLNIDPSLPADAKERLGQAVFIKNCLPCHRLDGAGENHIGPDLGRPMNVTMYMTPPGLRALIRDPKSVRTWPGQKMIGFGPDKIPDAEVDALVAFLEYSAKR